MLIEFGFVFGCIDVIKFYALRRIKSTKREFCGNGFSTVRIVKRLKNGKLHIVDAVLAELENRNNAAAEAEKQRIEAEKQDILADLDMYGI